MSYPPVDILWAPTLSRLMTGYWHSIYMDSDGRYEERSSEDPPEFDPDYMPGGSAAVRKGCTCPKLDNYFGHGKLGQGQEWWVMPDCLMHVSFMEHPDGRKDN